MGLTINCNTCKSSVTKKDTVFRCVSSENIMHTTTQCTQPSGTVINALQEINLNVLLLCNKCEKTNKRDVVLDAISSQNKIDKSNENQEEMKTFVKETVGNQLKKKEITSYKSDVESNLNDLGDVVTKKVKPKTKPPTNDHPSGVRVRGIPELKDTNARKRAEHDQAEIENILKFLNVDSNIKDCRRIGTYNENKDRTIIVKLSNDWNRKLLFLSLGKMRNYDKKVYLSRELSKEEQLLENDLLEKRREYIGSGLPRNKVKFQSLKLLHYDDQSNTWDEAALDMGWWLNTNKNRTKQITLLTFNVHSVLDPQRRFTLANAILTQKYDVLCLSETWLTKSVPNESFFLNNFQIFKNDRTSTENVSKHGGVLIAVRRDINAK